jgi:hypothetical protein
MSKKLQIQAFKYLALGLVGYLTYRKIKGIGQDVVDFADKKLNPASEQNLIYVGVKEVVGAKNLSGAGLTFFDAIDSAAEWAGFETGINGIEGTTQNANENLAKTRTPTRYIKNEQ